MNFSLKTAIIAVKKSKKVSGENEMESVILTALSSKSMEAVKCKV